VQLAIDASQLGTTVKPQTLEQTKGQALLKDTTKLGKPPPDLVATDGLPLV